MNIRQINKVNVGAIGCGNISGIYLKIVQQFEILNVYACADLDMGRAQAKAEEFKVPGVLTPEELLADPQVDIVLNLTIPNAHAEVALAALEAGKSVYNEKPLSVRREEATHMLEIAGEHKVLLGGAPDTVLGGGLQTCRHVLDSGLIGELEAATVFMISHGHESWHPNPAFYYEVGGGLMFDMGPYCLTALITLLGPVRRVSGVTRITFLQRIITSQPKSGATIQVEVPTHVAGLLEFSSGPIGTIVTTFDVWAGEVPRLEIYGSKGSLSLPDPNTFAGPVRVLLAGERSWTEISLTHGYSANSRGIGVADMAYALRTGSPQRASGERAYHLLDIMQAVHEAAQQGRYVMLESTCVRPEPFPTADTERIFWQTQPSM